jgi:hypothetical protein
MAEPVVCIFPHSDDEFKTVDNLRSFLQNELPSRPGGRYLLRKMGWKDKDFKVRVIPGSLVLFRKKGLIVGQAISHTMIKELEPPEQYETETGDTVTYYHDILFVPESIELYQKALPIQEIEHWARRKLDPRYYSILGYRQAYQQRFGAK